jgi:Flp pilus assembly protein TadD
LQDSRSQLAAAFATGDLAGAERLAAALLADTPADPDLLNVLGVVRLGQGRAAAARALFVAALIVAPAAEHPALNLALTFHAQGVFTLARLWAWRARQSSPDLVDAYATEASVERLLGRRRAASSLLRKALALAPAVPEFLANTGNALLDDEDLAAARRQFARALATGPGHGAARYQLAILDLGDGKLEQGWPNYEARFLPPALVQRRPFPQPAWRGETLRDGTLLIWGEQGIGDEIIFAALLPDASRRAPRVAVECDPRLVSILHRSMPDLDVHPRQTPPVPALASPAIVRQAAIGSLPALLWPSSVHGRTSTAYLRAELQRLAVSRDWLRSLGGGPKIGIAWRSGRTDPTATRLSTPIESWDPILSTQGAVFVNLQYGDCGAEIAMAERRTGVRLHRMPGLDLFNDLEGTLALSASLDLTISAATSAFSFPAAAGVETWMIRFESDFFVIDENQYAWFPRVRSFSRPSGAGWSVPIAAAATALAGWLRERQEFAGTTAASPGHAQ